jgi:hypothetical protein
MAGVGATLAAHDDVGAGTEVIDDLAFALVTPLPAQHDTTRHSANFLSIEFDTR